MRCDVGASHWDDEWICSTHDLWWVDPSATATPSECPVVHGARLTQEAINSSLLNAREEPLPHGGDPYKLGHLHGVEEALRRVRNLDPATICEGGDACTEAQEYRGNSAWHWWAKAQAYGAIVHACEPALEAAGYAIGRGPDGPARPIAEAVEALAAERDAWKAAAEEWESIFGLHEGFGAEAGAKGLAAKARKLESGE